MIKYISFTFENKQGLAHTHLDFLKHVCFIIINMMISSLGVATPETTERLPLITEPSRVRLLSAEFNIGDNEGIELKPGEGLIFRVPTPQMGKVLDNVIIRHRKNVAHSKSYGEDGYATQGAYTQVVAYDERRDIWINLGQPKFAEFRKGGLPEEENLHDCITFGPITPTHIIVISVGSGEHAVVNFHSLEVNFFPSELRTKMEMIFTPQTRFANPSVGVLTPTYGGGDRPNMGIYPYAVPINLPGIKIPRFPVTTNGEGRFYLERGLDGSTGAMIIPVKETVDVQRIEVIAGDTEDYGNRVYKNTINGPECFRRGHARLYAHVITENGTTVPLIDNANVPPRGVLKGSPPIETGVLKLEAGSKIVVGSRYDTTYVMGIRIQ